MINRRTATHRDELDATFAEQASAGDASRMDMLSPISGWSPSFGPPSFNAGDLAATLADAEVFSLERHGRRYQRYLTPSAVL
jgi:hypothetical protein